MGAKVQIKNDSINNFGGFYFCIDHFRSSGLAEIIDNTLGVRSVLAQYSYSEIVETLMSIYLTGGSRIEDAKRLSASISPFWGRQILAVGVCPRYTDVPHRFKPHRGDTSSLFHHPSYIFSPPKRSTTTGSAYLFFVGSGNKLYLCKLIYLQRNNIKTT